MGNKIRKPKLLKCDSFDDDPGIESCSGSSFHSASSNLSRYGLLVQSLYTAVIRKFILF